MKRHDLLLIFFVAVALMLGGTASAQNNSAYFVTYFSNALHSDAAPDSTVRVINDGSTGANLWASFYVFDDSQELQECCSCAVTPDGLTSESMNNNLTGNPLTGRLKSTGVIKMISSSVAAGGPNFTNKPASGLRVWATHVQRVTPTSGGYRISESMGAASNLASSEETLLETLCFYVNLLDGGRQGICSCTPEDADF